MPRPLGIAIRRQSFARKAVPVAREDRAHVHPVGGGFQVLWHIASKDEWAGCRELDQFRKEHFVDAYLERLTKRFRNALENARRDGDVAQDADLDDLAAFFTMSVVGISVLLRAKATPEQMYAASRGVTSILGQA